MILWTKYLFCIMKLSFIIIHLFLLKTKIFVFYFWNLLLVFLENRGVQFFFSSLRSTSPVSFSRIFSNSLFFSRSLSPSRKKASVLFQKQNNCPPHFFILGLFHIGLSCLFLFFLILLSFFSSPSYFRHLAHYLTIEPNQSRKIYHQLTSFTSFHQRLHFIIKFFWHDEFYQVISFPCCCLFL